VVSSWPERIRSIFELNPIVARLAKFSRSEIRKLRRRIRSESGPAGDRQAVLAYISLLKGADKPVVATPERRLRFRSPSSRLGSWLL
jgi:hypothetical protein